jgi:hypothetical protein
MSLVAALLVGSSSFALENVKVSGDAKLYYETVGSTNKAYGATAKATNNLGSRQGDNGQAALTLNVTADLVKNVSAGTSVIMTNTLGLENNLVSGTWAGPLANAGTSVDRAAGQNATAAQWWIAEAWLATTVDNTTAKVGRQYLDTPLAFTETWNIAKNSFAAAVVINQDVPDTTLVGAFVGQGNGASGGATVATAGNGDSPFVGYKVYNNSLNVLTGTTTNEAGGTGAYAAGLINNTIKPLVFQAWYYNVSEVAKAYWLQADVKVGALSLGAQYASMDPERFIRLNDTNADAAAQSTDASGYQLQDSKAYSVMGAFEVKDIATLKAAYSKTDDKGFLNVANTATGNQSKLYTEAWWNYGYVGMPGTTSYMLGAEGELKDMFTWFAQYTSMSVNPNDGIRADETTVHYGTDKITEFAVGASKSFGPLDTTLAYINSNVDKASTTGGDTSWVARTQASNTGDYSDNRIQAYLTLNF